MPSKERVKPPVLNLLNKQHDQVLVQNHVMNTLVTHLKLVFIFTRQNKQSLYIINYELCLSHRNLVVIQ